MCNANKVFQEVYEAQSFAIESRDLIEAFALISTAEIEGWITQSQAHTLEQRALRLRLEVYGV